MRKSEHAKLLAVGCLSLLLYPSLQAISYLLNRDEYRYTNMNGWVNKSLRKGDCEEASQLAMEWLKLAERFRGWNYGNAIHDSYQALGVVALKQGDVDKAKSCLLSAGRTPGSPQLNSYGPRMLLARELLKVGEKDVVLKYLELVGRFCANEEKEDDPDIKAVAQQHKVQLEQWKSEVEEGKVPHHRMWT